MPAKLERCVKDVKAKGGKVNPWAVCQASIKGKTKRKRKKKYSSWSDWSEDMDKQDAYK